MSTLTSLPFTELAASVRLASAVLVISGARAGTFSTCPVGEAYIKGAFALQR